MVVPTTLSLCVFFRFGEVRCILRHRKTSVLPCVCVCVCDVRRRESMICFGVLCVSVFLCVCV
jgi:hypothetical protein